jgi:hypothetical protein
MRAGLPNLYQLISSEVYTILEKLSQNTNNYVVKANPLSLERIDGKPIPQYIIDSVQKYFGD